VASLKNREELLCFLFATAASMFLLRAINEQKKKITMIFLGFISLAFSILSKQTGMVFCIIIPLILLQFHYKPINFKKIINQENKVLFKKYLFFIGVSILLGVFMNVFFSNNIVILLSLILFILFPAILFWLYVKQNNYNRTAKPDEKPLFRRYIFLSLFSLTIIILGYSFYKIPEIMLPSGNKPLYGFENPLFTDNSFYHRIGLGCISLLYYFKLIFVPFPLSFYYGYNMVPLAGISDFRVILSILIHISLFAVSIYYFYKNKMISFGILFYLIGLAMFANWFTVIPGIIGERLLFVSSFGFCIAICGVFWMVFNKRFISEKINSNKNGKIFFSVLIVIILLFSALTINRNKDWKNYSSLYTADINHLDKSAKANSLYADEIMRQEYENNSKNKPVDKAKIEIALKHYKRSIEIYPDYPSAYNNIGIIYMFYKDYDSSIFYLSKAEKFDSLNSQTDYNLGIAYDNIGDTSNALIFYEKAARKDSANIEFISHWTNLLNKAGNSEQAIEINLNLAKIKPLSDVPYINIGNYYFSVMDTATAVKYWEKAIEIAPSNDKLNSFLAEYFRRKGNEKKYSFYSEKKSQNIK
jgi:Tfp pilus assembly protein PilF